jgi:hypothetical protein
MECGQEVLRERIGRRIGAEEPDHRHRVLLRPRHERPRSRCTTNKRDELAPFHSITSSALPGHPPFAERDLWNAAMHP